jgi:hypothetical protein
MHDTYPQDDEPCWACIREFADVLIDDVSEENQKNTKPCRVDGKMPCVQYPDEINECNCDPCEGCEVQLTYTGYLKGILRKLVATKKASDSGQALVSCQGQAMNGYTELANYRAILEGIEID